MEDLIAHYAQHTAFLIAGGAVFACLCCIFLLHEMLEQMPTVRFAYAQPRTRRVASVVSKVEMEIFEAMRNARYRVTYETRILDQKLRDSLKANAERVAKIEKWLPSGQSTSQTTVPPPLAALAAMMP